MSTRILIVDDHPIVREGLRGVLGREPGLEVVGEAENGLQAIVAARSLSPDVIVMDIHMPGMNGIEASRRIMAESRDIGILVLSLEDDRRFIVDVLEAGAKGYLLKDSLCPELAVAVRAVAAGEPYLSPKISELIIRDYMQRIPDKLPLTFMALTTREREIIQLIADGANSKKIAARFGCSVKTVEVHRHNIMKKLDLYSIAELTKYAVREGLSSLS